MKNFRKGFCFMLMFALISIFALRTASITASSGTAKSTAIDRTQTNATDPNSKEVALTPVVAAGVAVGLITGWAVSEVLHHHFSDNEVLANNSEVKPVLEQGDKLFDL